MPLLSYMSRRQRLLIGPLGIAVFWGDIFGSLCFLLIILLLEMPPRVMFQKM